MNHAKLKIAIYFSKLNKWALLSPESFLGSGQSVYVDLAYAIAKNEMSLLGDRMIATLPPLSIELIGDPDDEGAILNDDDTAVFTTRKLKMRCGGNLMTNKNEKNIAFYLMRYGDWSEIEVPATITDGRLVSMEIIEAPSLPSDDHPFQVLGFLSSMISTAFSEMTTDGKRALTALDVKCDPDVFQIEIPKGYKGDALPLWQFILQPNMEFYK